MYSALGFGEPGPAPRTQILAGTGLARARPAAKAGVAAIEQRVVGYLVGVNIAPHIALSPVCQRVDLQQVVARAPLNQLGAGASGRLIAADAADPGAVGAQRIGQRCDFADAT